MKRRKKTNASRTSKRNRRPAKAGKNGAAWCGLFGCLGKAVQPVLKAIGWK